MLLSSYTHYIYYALRTPAKANACHLPSSGQRALTS